MCTAWHTCEGQKRLSGIVSSFPSLYVFQRSNSSWQGRTASAFTLPAISLALSGFFLLAFLFDQTKVHLSVSITLLKSCNMLSIFSYSVFTNSKVALWLIESHYRLHCLGDLRTSILKNKTWRGRCHPS